MRQATAPQPRPPKDVAAAPSIADIPLDCTDPAD